MPKVPDGTVVDESFSDDDTGGAIGSPEKEDEGCGGPNAVSGAGARLHWECHPHSPGPIDELIAALHEATLGPVYPRRHGLDPLPDGRPRSKFNPQF